MTTEPIARGIPRLADRLKLMVLTDPTARIGATEAVRAALQGGATAVQLRWKDAPTRALLEVAGELREITRAAGALLLVNDRVDVALAVAADGAHLGEDDLPLSAARAIVPPDFILGRSVDNAAEARLAQAEGADYIGLGPIHPTRSKEGLGRSIGPEGIAGVRSAVELPIVAIGGIEPSHVHDIFAAGAAGIAVISAIMHAADPAAAARALLA